MTRALILAISLALATPAAAEIVDGARVEVTDGDTVALPCAAPCKRERLRFYRMDSPELSGPRCEGELSLAEAARDRMRARDAFPKFEGHPPSDPPIFVGEPPSCPAATVQLFDAMPEAR